MPTDFARALKAVKSATEVVKSQGGSFIQSSSFRRAVQTYGRALRLEGLSDDLALHSLRYAHLVERYAQLEPQMGREEAPAKLSLDIGHGDGRGENVAKVYLSN